MKQKMENDLKYLLEVMEMVDIVYQREKIKL